MRISMLEKINKMEADTLIKVRKATLDDSHVLAEFMTLQAMETEGKTLNSDSII